MPETGIFGSALGRSFDASWLGVDALYHTPPRRGRVYESPAQPYFGQPHYNVGRETRVEQRTRAYNEPARPQVPLSQPQQMLMHQQQQVPQPPYIGQYPFRVPDTRQRKLGIRVFDGKELYQGLGSDFWTGEEVFFDKSTWRS